MKWCENFGSLCFFPRLHAEKVAIKIIDKTKLDDRARKILSREISCMERLNHPNVIRLYEVMDSLQKVHLVMECAADGELADRINNSGALSEAAAKPVFAQVVAAIQHMVITTSQYSASCVHVLNLYIRLTPYFFHTYL